LVIVYVGVEPAIAPGLIVQFPAGNPFNITLPVATAQVGWVIVPTIGTVGKAFTVNTCVAETELQPFVTVYVTVTVPAVRPVTTPPAVILAVPDTGTMDQTPPPVASVKAGVVDPTQTLTEPPPIADTVGKAFTVKDCVAEPEPQIFVTVYVTVTVPAVRPVTTPPAVILAVPVTGTTDQTPPPVASVKAGVVDPTQTLAEPPPIADTDGGGLTTCVLLAVAVPHDPPLVVSVNVAVPLYPPGGVHVAFNVVAFGVNVPNAGVDHVPPVAEPPTEPPNAADVPPWHMATRAEPALAVGKALTVTETDPGTVLTPSKTDTLYVILEIGLSVGLAMVDEKPGGVDVQV
jgi:hypothetical protein